MAIACHTSINQNRRMTSRKPQELSRPTHWSWSPLECSREALPRHVHRPPDEHAMNMPMSQCPKMLEALVGWEMSQDISLYAWKIFLFEWISVDIQNQSIDMFSTFFGGYFSAGFTNNGGLVHAGERSGHGHGTRQSNYGTIGWLRLRHGQEHLIKYVTINEWR